MTLLYTRTVYVWNKNWLDEATSEKMGSISGGENIADNLNCTECLHIYKYVNIATLKLHKSSPLVENWLIEWNQADTWIGWSDWS